MTHELQEQHHAKSSQSDEQTSPKNRIQPDDIGVCRGLDSTCRFGRILSPMMPGGGSEIFELDVNGKAMDYSIECTLLKELHKIS
jgi:hypothetical protein